MRFSKIYLQDNFVPDLIQDQFRRKVIGVEITLNEGESLDEAKYAGEKFIQEYIQANTTFHSAPILDQYQPPEPSVLPSIQVSKEEPELSLEEQIISCSDMNELNEFKIIASMNTKLQEVWDKCFEMIYN